MVNLHDKIRVMVSVVMCFEEVAVTRVNFLRLHVRKFSLQLHLFIQNLNLKQF